MVFRKSTTVLHKSSPESPGQLQSKASSKNKTYSLVYSSNIKSSELFIKTSKRVCVVCEKIDSTVKCKGPCQSFFHKECLNKSEERYHKKTLSCCKTNKTKTTKKKKGNIPQIINSIKDEKTDKLTKNGDKVKTKSLKSDDIFKNNSCILTDIANSQNKFKNVKLHGKSEEKNVDTSIVPINIKYMCSQCKADKTNCFVCGLIIEDTSQMISCKICK